MSVGLGLAAGPFVEAAAATREEAVALAREGETEAAIAALRELLAAAPNDALVAYDLAIILTWVGRNREATDVFENAGGDEPPEYVLGPIIRAYRDQKRFAEAERWARTAQQLFPFDATWAQLLGLVLADQGNTKEAVALLEIGRQTSRKMPRSGWRWATHRGAVRIALELCGPTGRRFVCSRRTAKRWSR